MYTEFDELTPTQCRYVRLTITDWPHIGNSPPLIMEFTVFGKANGKSVLGGWRSSTTK